MASNNPFLDDPEVSTQGNPFLPDPEDEDEDLTVLERIKRFFSSGVGEARPEGRGGADAGVQEFEPGLGDPDEPGALGDAPGGAEATGGAARALASGPAGTVEDLLQGFGADVDVPGTADEVPDEFGLTSGASRFASEMGLIFGGGAGIGAGLRGLSKLGQGGRISRGLAALGGAPGGSTIAGNVLRGFGGDAVRFGPVDAALAQNPETSGAIAIAELTGQEDLAERLRESRVERTLAEVAMGVIPGGAIETAMRARRGASRGVGITRGGEDVLEGESTLLERVSEGADEVRSQRAMDPDEARGGLTTDDNPSRRHLTQIESRESGATRFDIMHRETDEPVALGGGFLVNDGKRFHVSTLERAEGADEVGLSALRDMARDIRNRFPDVEEITGVRAKEGEELRPGVEVTGQGEGERVFDVDRLAGTARGAEDGDDFVRALQDGEVVSAIRDGEGTAHTAPHALGSGRPRDSHLDVMSTSRLVGGPPEDGFVVRGEFLTRRDVDNLMAESEQARRVVGEEASIRDEIPGESRNLSGFIQELSEGSGAAVDEVADTATILQRAMDEGHVVFDEDGALRVAEDAPAEVRQALQGMDNFAGEAGFALPDVIQAIGRAGVGGIVGSIVGVPGVEGPESTVGGGLAGVAVGLGLSGKRISSGLEIATDFLNRRAGAEGAEQGAEQASKRLDNLVEEDRQYIERLLNEEDFPDPPKSDPVDEAVRVTVPKDLDVNEVVERSTRRLEDADPVEMTEEYKRVKRLIQEGRVDDEQMDIAQTISRITSLDPQTVAKGSPDLSPEQQLAQALTYGTARQEYERLRQLMGKIGSQISEDDYATLVRHMERLNEVMDESLSRVMGIESEAGRMLRLAQEKWHSMPKTPDHMLGWEVEARRIADGAFEAEDRARLNRILTGDIGPDEMDIGSDIVRSTLARTIGGSIAGAGVGTLTPGVDAGEGALIGGGIGLGSTRFPFGKISSPRRIRAALRKMPEDQLKNMQLTRFMEEMNGRSRGWQEAYVDLVRAGLLSALKTDIVNIGSTLSHMAARRWANPGAAAVDRMMKMAIDKRIASRISSEGVSEADRAALQQRGTIRQPRTTALKMPEIKGGFATIEDGQVVIDRGRLGNAVEEARQVWRGSKQARDVLKRLDFSGWRTGNAFMDGVFEFGFRRLGAEDRAMKGMAFYTALRERARAIAMTEGADDVAARVKELLANPPDDMTVRAWQDAEVSTFTNQTMLGGAVTGFKQAMRRNGAFGAMTAEFGVPFVNTLVNVADSFLKFSPMGAMRPQFLGNLGEFVSAVAKGNRMSQESQRALAEAVSAGTLGTLAPVAAGGLMYQSGLMTGAWPSDSDANIMAQGNFQPYAVKLGDKTVSLENISPIGNSMAFGAHVASVIENPDIRGADQFTASVAGAFEQLGELSFLQSATTMLDGITDPERSASKAVDNLGRMHVPTILRQAASSDIPGLGDPTFRAGGGPGGLNLGEIPGIGAALKSTPGLGQTFEPQIDRLGRDRTRDPANFFEAAGNPFRIETIEDHPVIRELTRLGVGISDLSTPKRRRPQSVDDLPDTMPMEQREELVEKMQDPEHMTKLRRVYGNILKDRLTSIMKSPLYQQQPNEIQRGVLEKHIQSARRETTETLEQMGMIPPALEGADDVTPIFQRTGRENNPFLRDTVTESPAGTSVEDEGGSSNNPFLP